jgi:hypothetical protein
MDVKGMREFQDALPDGGAKLDNVPAWLTAIADAEECRAAGQAPALAAGVASGGGASLADDDKPACQSGGPGSSSCTFGGSLGPISVTCRDGFYACCTISGASCIAEAENDVDWVSTP